MTEHEKELWQQYEKNRSGHTDYAFDFEKNGRVSLSAAELNFIAFALKEAIANVMEGRVEAPTDDARLVIERVAVGEPICRLLAAVDQINTAPSGQLFELIRIDV